MDNRSNFEELNNDINNGFNNLNCNFNNLNNNFDNLSDNLNDLNDSLGLNGCVENAYDAGQLNGLQGLCCISRQYQSLVLLLILLYFWTTQYNTNYLMNSNNQLMGTYSCLLEKMVDNALENCSRCCSGTSPAESNKRHHKKHHCKRNDCCDCCDCDDDC